MVRITTCIMCGRQHEAPVEAEKTTCPHCRHWYWLDDDDEATEDDVDPDYGGAFDGHSVFSYADPGL